MGLRELLGLGGDPIDASTPAGRLLKAFVDPIRRVGWPVPGIETWPQGVAILEQEPAIRADIAVLACRTVIRERRRGRRGEDRKLLLKALVSRLLRTPLPFAEGQLVAIVRDLAKAWDWEWNLPVGPILSAIEHHVAEHGLQAGLREEATNLLGAVGGRLEKADRARLELLLAQSDDAGETTVIAADGWGDGVREDLRGLPDDVRATWGELLGHAAATAGRTRPTGAWRRAAAGPVERIGAAEVASRVGAWTEGFTPGPAESGRPHLGDANTELLRGLLWAAAPGGDAGFAARVGRLAASSFRKVAGHGPRSARLGNGCLVALGLVGDHLGVAELSRLAAKVRYATARRMIESTLERAAQRAGLDRDDLEDLGVPDHGLEPGGRASIPVGDGAAEVTIEEGAVQVRWQLAGRTTKGAPKALREAHPAEVREIGKRAKDLATTLEGQAARIEGFYLGNRELEGGQWRARLLDHPVVGTVARRLAWSLATGDGARTVFWRDGELRDLEGRPVADDVVARSRIRLWHPVGSSVDQVRRLRELLHDAEITQPFKQAHREVYLLTDAERRTAEYSNRFAAHVIRQHQFQALAQQRGWRYRLQGQFDSFNVPDRVLPAWDLAVELWVEPVGDHVTEAGIFQYLTTDQVRFRRAGGERLDLVEVPELPFSEALRDVDLFTSVASVGNDPTWQDRGEAAGVWGDYWTGFAFGDLNATAETRREVLAGLVPRLKIADRCRLEDRWLIVRGDLRTYRIHLRSGHVMMDPNQQYLCIVAHPGARGKGPKVRLPFEGDSVLSLILSKAFLLAADSKIEDRTILSQIRPPAG